MAVTGRVSLVGAGPGDPGLLTRRAIARLRAADLVFYDALIDERVLRYARKAQRFFVGKRAGRHAMTTPEPELGLLVYFHGGGWVIGDLDTHDDVVPRARQPRAAASSCRSTTGSRPSTRSRPALEDCYAATAWVAEHAAELGVDRAASRSAATARAATSPRVVALHGARRRRAATCASSSSSTRSPTHASTRRPIARTATGYFLDTRGDGVVLGPLPRRTRRRATTRTRRRCRADDARAASPPAFVITAEFDPLRDEGEAYAEAAARGGRADGR